MDKAVLAVALLCLFTVNNLAAATDQKCSYERCPELMPDMLNVHLICHTHDDAGWLKTFQQYFLGTNKTIAREGVRYILDSVVNELLHDSSKRFSYAESSFFQRWWHTKSDYVKHVVKKLVSKGQLEFVGGGMVQNDEASTHYTGIIDQMTTGHEFLRRTFGECAVPTVAWQIDTFGHSSENCALYLQGVGHDAGVLWVTIPNRSPMFSKPDSQRSKTNRSLGIRLAEHRGVIQNRHPEQSGTAAHALEEGHDFASSDVVILDRDANKMKLLVKEVTPRRATVGGIVWCCLMMADVLSAETLLKENFLLNVPEPWYPRKRKKKMGFNGLFFARLHYNDRKKRIDEHNMEMLWDCGAPPGTHKKMLTGAFYESYTPPSGFCFDINCLDDPVVDDTSSESYNIDHLAKALINISMEQAKAVRGSNIMLLMGGDFHYMSASYWFSNLDKLVKYINHMQSNGSKINMIYSTPSCYLRTVKKFATKLPVKSDDFFPYATKHHAYWTGYFTSRPALKKIERHANNILQVCQTFSAVTQLESSDFTDVSVLRSAVAIMQHHDAITGTAKQHVTNDYYHMLHHGIMECQLVLNDALKKIAVLNGSESPLPNQVFCPLVNGTVCDVTQHSDDFVVTFFNGFSHPMSDYARLPVYDSAYTVYDSDFHEIKSEKIQTFDTHQLPYAGQAPCELVFPIRILPLGYNMYFIKKNQPNVDLKPTDVDKRLKKTFCNDTYAAKVYKQLYGEWCGKPKRCRGMQQSQIENEHLTVSFDSTGRMNSVTDRQTGHVHEVVQSFLWYYGANNDKAAGEQPSGAYIFRPNGSNEIPGKGDKVITEKFTGTLVQEMRQKFSPWVSQAVRLYANNSVIELEWTVGPIPASDGVSKEVVARFQSRIKSSSKFYTDSNGRRMIKRVRNFQPTYKYNNSEPASGNYYPITRMIYLKDNDSYMAVLTDRSQGAASLQDGSLEIMLHRRTLYDDHFGVDEPLNETEAGKGLVIRGKLWLMIGNAMKNQHPLCPHLFTQKFYEPIMMFASVTKRRTTSPAVVSQFSALTRQLPPCAHVLTLAQLPDAKLLLRLENYCQPKAGVKDDPSVVVDLQALFTTFNITEVDERNLSGGDIKSVDSDRTRQPSTDFKVTLLPTQIRTFYCTISAKASKGKRE